MRSENLWRFDPCGINLSIVSANLAFRETPFKPGCLILGLVGAAGLLALSHKLGLKALKSARLGVYGLPSGAGVVCEVTTTGAIRLYC